MNCWKSVHLIKEFGQHRLYMVSFLISFIAFIVLYVPVSVMHGMRQVNEAGFVPFLAAVLFLPAVHAAMHILPLILMKKSIKIYYKPKTKMLPVFHYYTKSHLTKKASLTTALAPTFLLTLPGIAMSYLSPDYNFYLIMMTAIHIGTTFSDFLYASYVIRAPKDAYIETHNNRVDILLKKTH